MYCRDRYKISYANGYRLHELVRQHIENLGIKVLDRDLQKKKD